MPDPDPRLAGAAHRSLEEGSHFGHDSAAACSGGRAVASQGPQLGSAASSKAKHEPLPGSLWTSSPLPWSSKAF